MKRRRVRWKECKPCSGSLHRGTKMETNRHTTLNKPSFPASTSCGGSWNECCNENKPPSRHSIGCWCLVQCGYKRVDCSNFPCKSSKIHDDMTKHGNSCDYSLRSSLLESKTSEINSKLECYLATWARFGDLQKQLLCFIVLSTLLHPKLQTLTCDRIVILVIALHAKRTRTVAALHSKAIRCIDSNGTSTICSWTPLDRIVNLN